jgi:photosystem II stability/assembly factor-like uncharacterized protein
MSRRFVGTLIIGVLVVTGLACSLNSQSPSPTPLPTQTIAVEVNPTQTRISLSSPTLAPTAISQPSSTPVPTTATLVPPTSVPHTLTLVPHTPTLEPSPASTLPPGPYIASLQSGTAVVITYIRMFNTSSGWAIGGSSAAGGHVLHTYDGGNTWVDRTPPEPLPQNGPDLEVMGFFPNDEMAWVTFYSSSAVPPAFWPAVWRTTDGGLNWQASQPLDTTGLDELYWPSDLLFATPRNGWLLVHVGAGMSHDYVALFRTADGGQTWERLLDPYTDGNIQGCSKNAMLFTDALNGWLAGDCNGVMAGVFLNRTTDGGVSWQPVDLPAPEANPDIFITDTYACGAYSPISFTFQIGKIVVRCRDFSQSPIVEQYYLYITPDGGNYWISTPFPGGYLEFLNADQGWALGQNIYQTQDGGATWTMVKTVTWNGQFSFVDEQNGWAVARSDGEIALVHTTDGGQSWEIILPLIAP